jgi:hypothetical protein
MLTERTALQHFVHQPVGDSPLFLSLADPFNQHKCSRPTSAFSMYLLTNRLSRNAKDLADVPVCPAVFSSLGNQPPFTIFELATVFRKAQKLEVERFRRSGRLFAEPAIVGLKLFRIVICVHLSTVQRRYDNKSAPINEAHFSCSKLLAPPLRVGGAHSRKSQRKHAFTRVKK